jgi:DNA-binding response OmpR family regulator
MRKTALVVDDEDIPRNFISHILKSLGFYVIEADTEESAWNSYIDNEEDLDYIITEIHLVRGSGLSLYQRIRNRDKNKTVVVCDDCYVNNDKDVINDPNAVLLVKPFPVDTLIETTNLPNYCEKIISV